MRASPRFLFVIIPLIDRIVDHPSDPIASQAAIARTSQDVGQFSGRAACRRTMSVRKTPAGGAAYP